MQSPVCHEDARDGTKCEVQSQTQKETAGSYVEAHEGSEIDTGRRLWWFQWNRAVGIRCTGLEEFSRKISSAEFGGAEIQRSQQVPGEWRTERVLH